jgi:hypothetical protein
VGDGVSVGVGVDVRVLVGAAIVVGVSVGISVGFVVGVTIGVPVGGGAVEGGVTPLAGDRGVSVGSDVIVGGTGQDLEVGVEVSGTVTA